jgi:hypothetical protein
MSREVQRFIVHACPAPEHPEFYCWQTATLCLFVGDDDHRRAYETARNEIARRHWMPIGTFAKDTLIEKRVLDEAPENVRQAYIGAKAGQLLFKVEFDQIPFARKNGVSPIRGPRVDEGFIDDVIVSAGGHRLTKDEAGHGKSESADYVIGHCVLELKHIQEEGLLVASRQRKLAQLLRGIAPGSEYVSLSPKILTRPQWLKFADILGGPVKTHVKKAARQIKSSRQALGCSEGGVIFLNTGYSGLPHDLFRELVDRYCDKDTSQIGFAICISSWAVTNGIESQLCWAFSPEDGGGATIAAVRDCFWREVMKLMASWARGGFDQGGCTLDPIAPIAFRENGTDFSTQPPGFSVDLDQ